MTTLVETLRAVGMTPPDYLPLGRFRRFPGCGKPRGNTAGWCKLITPTLAVYGDWSTGLSETWTDETHVDDETSRRLLAEARERERQAREQLQADRAEAAQEARRLIAKAKLDRHPYLAMKGFPDTIGLVLDGKLIVPMRDVRHYRKVLSCQLIDADGTKKFLPRGRASGAVYRLGGLTDARKIAICEGYSTALSVYEALKRLDPTCVVVAALSAHNLTEVAPWYLRRDRKVFVVADNDVSGAGQRAAAATALPYWMPPIVGEDFNDFYQRLGLFKCIGTLREFLHEV